VIPAGVILLPEEYQHERGEKMLNDLEAANEGNMETLE
jgi:hypothetical protein